MKRLATALLADVAVRLNLRQSHGGEIEVPMLGHFYLAGANGVRSMDGRPVSILTAAVIAGYLLRGGWGETTGRFVALRALTGTATGHDSFQASALATPLVKRFTGRLDALVRAVERLGGRRDGQAGGGGLSLVFEVLPKLPLQVIWYDQDREFPAEVTFLLDLTAPNFLDYEYLAVMLTICVRELLATDRPDG
jgi:hypothetical protein